MNDFKLIGVVHSPFKNPVGIPIKPVFDEGAEGTVHAPCRPNAIGLSCVRLLSVAGKVLAIGGVDILDGTPLLDIKPYVPKFDAFPNSRAGWCDRSPPAARTHADDRFAQ